MTYILNESTLSCNYCGQDIDQTKPFVRTVGNTYHKKCEGALQPSTPRVLDLGDQEEVEVTLHTNDDGDRWSLATLPRPGVEHFVVGTSWDVHCESMTVEQFRKETKVLPRHPYCYRIVTIEPYYKNNEKGNAI